MKQPNPVNRQLGDYRLRQLLGENDSSRRWLAEQTSISRQVLVDELRPDRPARREDFLADVRAKASVDHPIIGSIYEAVAEPDLCFYAHELLVGRTLAEREPLPPSRLANVLRRIAEAQLQHESAGHSTAPLTLDAIHLDDHSVIRLKNLVIAGPRAEGNSSRDISLLGHQLVPLVASGKPGATRLLTLLSWMRGEALPEPLTWAQTRDICLQIEHQLADPLSVVRPTQPVTGVRKRPRAVLALGTLLVLLAIAALAVKLRPPEPPPPPRASLPDPVLIPAGRWISPDGMERSLPEFVIGAHEVTVGEYAEFLQTLAVLARSGREKTFDAQDQPAAKTSHEPDEWAALSAPSGLWKGLKVSPDVPVVGVDWWDAVAYAEWKKARLPTQDEWFAALSAEMKVPAALAPAGWGEVSGFQIDRTPNGLLGMAGSVAEWTADRSANPANPLGEKLWVIAGGSYLNAGSNALTREWTANRSLRRPDLGFRVVLELD